MNRREFLKATAVGLGSAQAGCATLPIAERQDPFSPERMREFLGRFDAGLAAIDAGRDLRVGGVPAPDLPGAEEGVAMAKRSLRALYAVGAFADLSLEEQAHPGVQARMGRMLPELERSLRESKALVEGMTPGHRAALQEALRRDPSIPVKLAEAVDDAGGDAQVSARTRRKFRTLTTQVSVRLRHQDPAVLMNEYVNKVRKLEAWSGTEAELQRQLAARIGREALGEQEARFADARRRWSELLGPAEGAGDGADGAPWRGPLRTAAWSFGLGVLTIGIAFAASNIYVATAGAILIVVALIALVTAGVLGLATAVGDAIARPAARRGGEEKPEEPPPRSEPVPGPEPAEPGDLPPPEGSSPAR
jgi:hypothetical protein